LDLLISSRAKVRELLTNPALPEADLSVLRSVALQCDVLESHWGELEDMCSGLPRTVVHGDFVIKNVRVGSARAGSKLLVFDWEFAAWGTPATDLAQFTGGTVSPDLLAYCSVMERCGTPLDVRAVQELAKCGEFFRLLAVIHWALLMVVDDSYLFLEKPISHLRSYETRLAEALRAAHWARSV